MRRSVLDLYYRGRQPLAYLSPEARVAIGTRFGRMATNVPRLAVNALAKRLRVTGFTGADVWADWLRCDMDQLAPVAHREALTLGESYVIVWADAAGRPLATVESPTQVAVVRDPATREVIAAVKRWETKATTEATLFTPDAVTRLRSDALGATTNGFRTVETLTNPFGVVPVVPLRNSDRLLGDPASEIDDLIPLVDGMNKLLADLMVSSEYTGRPRRWATGIELEEVETEDGETVAVNPFPESNRMMVSESPKSKFGQLDASDLAGYENAVRVLQAQISAVSGLPPHYLGVHGDQPASADALRASEASLTARAGRRRAHGHRPELIVAAPTATDVAGFLGQGDDASVVALAEEHLPFVTATVRAYTRGAGFTTDGPADDLALVIIASTARLVTNPALARSETVGAYSVTHGQFLGWTLPELAILNRYRKRAL